MRADLDVAHEMYHNSYLQSQKDSDAAEKQHKEEMEALEREENCARDAYLAVWKAQNHDQQAPELIAAKKQYVTVRYAVATRQHASWRRYWDAQHKIDNTLTEAHDLYLEVWSRERQRA
jgi:hypothetical protein